ncbi:MAG: SRPBCC family protein [Eubacteriales bacterium]|nr:SRPBCC family protein [Eubacteriales bacterium]
MEQATRISITVETTVPVSPALAWAYWTEPKHITQWNQASDDWHTPRAENDLRAGGKFSSRMESKDGKYGFDFGGVYDAVEPHHLLASTLGDGRKVRVTFESVASGTRIVETFDTESENSVELQRQGWQAILDSYRRYVEKQ